MMRTTSRIAALLIAVIVLLGVSACGSSSDPTACFVLDASKSARFALFDYEGRFAEALDEAARRGDAVAAVVATGDPLVESNVERGMFSGLTNADQEGDRIAAVEDFSSRVEDAVLRAAVVRNLSPGSGIVAAIDLVSGEGCASIEALSDGLEASDVRMKQENILTAQGRIRLLDRLDARGLLPNLDGVELHFPFGGYLPQGTAIPKARLDAVPVFWDDYAERTGATVSWRR